MLCEVYRTKRSITAMVAKMNINIDSPEGMGELTENLQYIMRVTIAKSASRELGFICLFTDDNGTYWFKVSRGFATAINESIASIEKLVDDANNKNLDEVQKEKINNKYAQIFYTHMYNFSEILWTPFTTIHYFVVFVAKSLIDCFFYITTQIKNSSHKQNKTITRIFCRRSTADWHHCD